jgi:hypothetical protein
MPAPGAFRGPALRPQPVHGVARFAFWTLLVLSATNAIGFVTNSFRRLHNEAYELSLYPIVFAVFTVFVLAFSKSRVRSTLLVVAWVFWLLFFLSGFLGPAQITGTDIRSALRTTLKPWMALIGLPWLALRAVSEDKVPRLIHATVIVTCLGALVGILQLALPGIMERLMDDAGRAEGLWSSPNTSGVVCAMALFLSLLFPFQSHLLNWTTRLLLLAAVGASLSRGAILALVLSWVVYTITARRFGTLVKSTFALVIFVATTLIVLATIESDSEFQEGRIASLRSLLSGEWRSDTFKNRTDLWVPALDAVMSGGGFLFGLGHGSMDRIVAGGDGGVGPHNYYVYILGNSGVFALLGLLVFHFYLFQQAFRCTDRTQRAALIAIAACWALVHLFDDGLIGHPVSGALLACIMVTVAYARPRDGLRLRTQRPSYNGVLRPRPV